MRVYTDLKIGKEIEIDGSAMMYSTPKNKEKYIRRAVIEEIIPKDYGVEMIRCQVYNMYGKPAYHESYLALNGTLKIDEEKFDKR